MSLTWTNEGEKVLLARFCTDGLMNAVLFTNDVALDDDLELADLDLVDEGTYPFVTNFVNLDHWATPTSPGGVSGSTCGDTMVVTHDGVSPSLTVYGYAILDSDTNMILYAVEKFDAPVTLATADDQLEVTVRLTLRDDND